MFFSRFKHCSLALMAHAGLVGGAILLVGAGQAQAQALCNDTVVTTACSDPTGDGCLETLHACGRDEVILSSFKAELKGLTPHQRYFVALAYYARATQTGSKGVRCDAISEARDSLDSFLYDVQDNYRLLKSYGSESDMKAIYHAARLREQLKGETDCLESGHTIASLRRWVRDTAGQRIQDLFFGLKGDDGLDDTLASVWTTLQSAMNEFVTRAAQTESLVQKTRAKLDTANDTMSGTGGTKEHLNNIVTVNANGTIDKSKLSQTKTRIDSTIKQPITAEVAKFTAATEGMTPEEFGKARDTVSAEARGLLNSLSWGSSHLGTSYLAPGSDFAAARTAVFSNTGGVENPTNTLYSIHNAWKQAGSQAPNNHCALATKPWYCLVAPAN